MLLQWIYAIFIFVPSPSLLVAGATDTCWSVRTVGEGVQDKYGRTCSATALQVARQCTIQTKNTGSKCAVGGAMNETRSKGGDPFDNCLGQLQIDEDATAATMLSSQRTGFGESRKFVPGVITISGGRCRGGVLVCVWVGEK